MTDLSSVRQRARRFLAQLTSNQVIGTGGLAILCAASAFALAPTPEAAFTTVLAQWLGGLGLNVLAGVLQGHYQDLRTKPSQDEIDRMVNLAESLAQDIEHQPELRREIGVFLETVNAFDIAEEVVKGDPGVHGWLLFKIYQDVIQYQNDFDRIQQKLDQIKIVVEELRQSLAQVRPFTIPPPPSIFIGRAEALRDIKSRLGIVKAEATTSPAQKLTVVRGWPGVGKTTLTATLAYDPDVASIFPDGILWVSLGTTPNLLSELATWGRALGTDELLRARTLEEARAQLASLLRNKHMLLIVDDAWEAEHAIPFNVGGSGCAMLITTRLPEVASILATTPDQVYILRELSDEKALELLKTIATNVVQQYPQEALVLVHELEGLPLALHVAGRLLNVEISIGFNVPDLITQLRVGAQLLKAKAPQDRIDLKMQTIPTVAVLLQKSTDHLDHATRDCFAYLGAFAPKPATFDLAAMQAVWQVEDPKPFIRTLVDRGLLEFIPTPGRYQMHALLVMHAKSLLTED